MIMRFDMCLFATLMAAGTGVARIGHARTCELLDGDVSGGAKQSLAKDHLLMQRHALVMAEDIAPSSLLESGGAVATEQLVKKIVSRMAASNQEVGDDTRILLEAIMQEMDVIINSTIINHQKDQAAVNISFHSIKTCVNRTADANTDFLQQLDALNGNHTSCREMEVDRKDDADSVCDDFESFASALEINPAKAPISKVNENELAALEWIQNGLTYLTNANATFIARQSACKGNTSLHSQQRASCQLLQAQVQSKFCSSENICDDLLSCHSEHNKTHHDLVEAMVVAEESRKAEFLSAHRIQCYINALNASEVERPAMAENCGSMRVNMSRMEMFYPQISLPVCHLSTPDTYCDDFKNASRYPKAPADACVPCSTTTKTTQVAQANMWKHVITAGSGSVLTTGTVGTAGASSWKGYTDDEINSFMHGSEIKIEFGSMAIMLVKLTDLRGNLRAWSTQPNPNTAMWQMESGQWLGPCGHVQQLGLGYWFMLKTDSLNGPCQDSDYEQTVSANGFTNKDGVDFWPIAGWSSEIKIYVKLAPATPAPPTEAPATEAPATPAPPTEAPATPAPPTEVPATPAPPTEAPATPASPSPTP
jgi:hypothetical protein